MDDDGGYVAGLFDNISAARECYRYYSECFPRTSLIPICTNIIESTFVEPVDL
jgi:hypothetical protein